MKTNRDFRNQATERVRFGIKQASKWMVHDYRFNSTIGTYFSTRLKFR